MNTSGKSVVIMDTDAGLDDAAAVLLCKSTGLRIDYYVCTEGNTTADGVVRNISILRKYLNLDSRIVRGCSVHDGEAGDFYGEDGLANLSEQMMDKLNLTQDDIVPDILYNEFKQELLNYDHITYIAVSPLITLADLIKDESIKAKIDNVYIMGGGIREFNSPDDTEYNFHENPEAVKKVLSSGLNITLFPLDLTVHQGVNEEQIEVLESTKKYPEYIQMFRFIKKQNLEYDHIDAAILHDTMPVLYCVYPEKFVSEDMKITCGTNGHLDIADDGYAIRVVLDADSSLMQDKLKEAFITGDINI